MNRKESLAQLNKIKNNQNTFIYRTDELNVQPLHQQTEPITDKSELQTTALTSQVHSDFSTIISSSTQKNIHNLSFDGADIRGLNFSNLDLTGVDFSNTIAGITNSYENLLFALSIIVVLIFIFIVEFASERTVLLFFTTISKDRADETIINLSVGLYTLTMFIVPIVGTIFKSGLIKTINSTLIVGFFGVGISILYFLALILVSFLTRNTLGNNMVLFSPIFQRTITSGITGVVVALSSVVISASFTITSITKSQSIYNFFWFISCGAAILISILGFSEHNDTSRIITPIFGVVAILCGSGMKKESLVGNKKYEIIQNTSVKIVAFRGTRFENSTLNQASFERANLKFTNFKQSTKNHTNLVHTRWLHSKGLNYALLDNTILDNNLVRELLTKHYSQNRVFRNCDFTGANLSFADLSNMDFTDSNFTNALLERANLRNSILTRVNLVSSVLSQAVLTGASGIGTLNTNNATQFGGIKGDYVYLSDQNTDRYPLLDTNLGEGELEKYLRREFNTVDFSFPNGVHLKAFTDALNQCKIFSGDDENLDIKIDSIIDKGNGNILIKINIPSNKNKEKFYFDLLSHYEERCQTFFDYYHSLYLKGEIEIESLTEKLAKATSIYQIVVNNNFNADVQNVIGYVENNDNHIFENVLTQEAFTFLCEALTNNSSPKVRAFAAKSLGLFRPEDFPSSS
jgi:uncharacterized protein YjbI with pentapeptide repeats